MPTTFLCSSISSARVPFLPPHLRPFPNPMTLSSSSLAASSPTLSPASTSGDNVGGGRSGAISPAPIEDSVPKIDVNPPRGTRYFPSADMGLRNWLFHHFKEFCQILDRVIFSNKENGGLKSYVFLVCRVSRLFGFEEVDFPVLESEALFVRKAGEAISDQRRKVAGHVCWWARYDHLLSTLGGDEIPGCGFGFGDAIIIELLKEKGLLPELSLQVENIVCALDHYLQGAAAAVAT